MESDPAFNPLAGNPLRTRKDLLAALRACSEPLDRLDHPNHGTAALEWFARPLWGLAVANEASLETLGSRLAAGVDPAHAGYWGAPEPCDQKIVELAALGFALCAAKDRLWDPLPAAAKANLSAYLRAAAEQPVFDNNWHFFPVLIALGLRHVGEPHDAGAMTAHLDAIDSFYLGDGWYSDGDAHRTDHYCGFAFHFYGLLYCGFAPEDEVRCATYRDRATAFAQQFIHWFADDGGALPYGRSLAYRFACAAFFGACALAGVEALPWSVMKGLYLRHLRWWRQWPVTQGDGLLSRGFGYPNPALVEDYVSAASPYWAFKAFLPLALPDDHPFWQADEAPMPRRDPAPTILWHPGMIVAHEPGQTIALAAGQTLPHFRGSPEKYTKFAYSTRYAYGIEDDAVPFEQRGFESMIGFRRGDGLWQARRETGSAAAEGDMIYARWEPWTDVAVETWLYWDWPWHIRVHRVRAGGPLETLEGGFALPGADLASLAEDSAGRTAIETPTDFSGIADLSPGRRGARILRCRPLTHLLHPQTVVPQLLGRIDRGESLLACAVIASPDGAACAAAWRAPLPAIRPIPVP